MSGAREAAIYCATTNARIRGTESTWTYFDDDGEVAITATVDASGKIRIKGKRL